MTLGYLLRRWPLLLGVLVIGIVAGLIAAKLQTKRYTATMTISSVGPEDLSLPLGSSITGGAGVLQALKGVTGGASASAGNSDYGYFIALLTSDRTARALLADPLVMHRLFPREWDDQNKRWHRPRRRPRRGEGGL